MIAEIAEGAVRRRQFTLVLFAAMAAIGISSFMAIPRAEDPSFPNPIFAVIAVFPGGSPAEIEAQVVDPLEDALETLDDLKRVRSRVEDGLAVIRVEFDAGSDADAKYDDVLRQLSAERPNLPSALLPLEVRRFETTNVSIAQLALVSPTASWDTLRELSDRLVDQLEAVPGTKDVEVWGLPDKQVRVSLDMPKLARLGISVSQLMQAIQGENASIPGGRVDAGGRTLNVETSGRYRTLEEVSQTVIGGIAGQLVHLADVAQVGWAHADETHIARYGGQRAIFVSVSQKDRQNIFATRDLIAAIVNEAQASLPPDVRLERGFDQAANVEHRLDGLERDFALAILLVLVTLLPLGFRAAVIVMISIPLSLAMGVAMLHFGGYTINQLSIVGFVIALGLLVDDSIVVTENITRFLRMGYSRVDAAIAGTKQIAVAVLGCTATLLFAFLPLLFLPGSAGMFIRSMPMAVVLTIGASLLVSITIIPLLASLLLKPHEEGEGRVFRLVNGAIEASYRPVLRWALAYPKTTAIGALVVFVASLAVVPVIGFSLFPKAGTPQFLITLETPEGTSLAQTDEAARFVERVLAKRPELDFVMTNVGHGNPMVYYNVAPAETRSNRAELFVQGPRRSTAEAARWFDTLRVELAEYPGARIEVKEFENGPPIDAPIAIRLTGPDLAVLRQQSAELAALLERTPGTRDVKDPLREVKTDLSIKADAGKAGLVGVPVVEIDRTIRLGLAGLALGEFRTTDGDEFDIVLTVPRAGRASLESLRELHVFGIAGQAVPLAQLAQVGWTSSPPQIDHENGLRAVTVTAQVQTGFNTDRVTQEVLRALGERTLPAGYRWTAAGEIESRKESFGGLGAAILVAVFGVLSVLVLEFGTFKSTLIVASVIPLGIVGGLVALLLTGNSLSFTAVIGFVALVGIEVKNSILLVDFTHQLREQGVDLDTAIRQAGEIRFFPILLTTLTAVGGLLPLALAGSSLYSPLAWVILGGLISSTLLSRLVTPVMYKLLAPEVEVVAPAASSAPATAVAAH